MVGYMVSCSDGQRGVCGRAIDRGMSISFVVSARSESTVYLRRLDTVCACCESVRSALMCGSDLDRRRALGTLFCELPCRA
jgi:hypothetical protein